MCQLLRNMNVWQWMQSVDKACTPKIDGENGSQTIYSRGKYDLSLDFLADIIDGGPIT